MNQEAQFNVNEKRRLAADDRYLDKIDAAFDRIGELSSGKCYVYPVGGKYREGSRADLIAFLVRNNYA